MAIAAFYFSYLGAIGIFLPFISLYLAGSGLAAEQVTQVMALGPLAALLVPPLVGLLADLRRARVWLLRGGTLVTGLVSVGFVVERPGLTALVATMAAFSFFRAPLLSLADAAALERGARDAGSYGRLRLWGSLGFLLAVLGGGWLHDRLGADHVMVACTAGLGLATLAAVGLPAPPVQARPRIWTEWRRMLGQRELWLFLAAAGLGQAAGAAYDGGFSMHLKRLGFDGRFIGRAWAVGVAAEIGCMALSGPILRRLGPARLFTLGTAAGALRWFCLGRARSPWLILALQPLHGLTFGLCYVAAVHLMRARGRGAPTAAQGLYAMAMMIGQLGGMLVAGALLDRRGGQGMFDAAALVALLAAGCALGYSRSESPDRRMI